jgi:hypothetical protein
VTILVAEDRDDDAVMRMMMAVFASGAARRRQQERRGEARNAGVAPARGNDDGRGARSGLRRRGPASRREARAREDAAPARSAQDGARRRRQQQQEPPARAEGIAFSHPDRRGRPEGADGNLLHSSPGARWGAAVCPARSIPSARRSVRTAAGGCAGQPRQGSAGNGRDLPRPQGGGGRRRGSIRAPACEARGVGREDVCPSRRGARRRRGAWRPRLPRSQKGIPEDFCEAFVLPVACGRRIDES